MNQIKMGAVLSYIGLLATMIVALFYTPILVKQLGQAEYGVYTLIGAFVGYLTILDMGLGNAIVRYVARTRANNNREQESKLSGMFLVLFSIIGILVCIIGTVLYFQIDNLFAEKLTQSELNIAKKMAIILIVNFAVSFPLSVFGALIHAYEKFIFIKLTAVIRTFLTPMVIVPMLFLGYGSVTVVLLTTIVNILFLLVNVYYVFKKLHIKVEFTKFDNLLLKEILIYSSFIFINAIIDKIYWSTDQIILGAVSGANQVAIYAIAMQFVMIYMTISTSISGLFLPKVSIMEMNGAKNSEFSNLFLKVGRIQSFIMVPTLFSFYIIGMLFINLWVGDTYKDAYYIVLFIMIPLTIALCQNVGISILQAKNLHAFRSIVYFGIAVINILISIPVAKDYGTIGVAIVTALSLTLGNIVIINIYYKKKLELDMFLFWKNTTLFLGANLIIVLVSGYIVKILFQDAVYQQIIHLIIYIILILNTLYFFFLKSIEREIIKKKIVNIVLRIK